MILEPDLHDSCAGIAPGRTRRHIMHSESKTDVGITVVGIFPEIADARRATDDLHSQGISTARLVENELAVTFTGTAEREGAGGSDHGGSIKGFFARLFGWNDHRSDWKLNADTESYFQDAYNKKHHIVIIEDCRNVSLCRDIIAARGGTSEELGGHHYQAGAGARTITGENASDSGLGVDVDRMPFSHTQQHQSRLDSDRALDGMSGDADRTPLAGQGAHRVGVDRALNTTLVGDDRIHDHGVSNADVARISSDRIMELDDDDQELVDDERADNGHILPDRSFPEKRSGPIIPPGP
jgi:hypothetical protein